MRHALRLALIAACLAAGAARAQQALDVPFVGTPAPVIDKMLELGRVGRDDHVIDLGCGDGRLVIAAARRFGASGYGVDLDAALVDQARQEAQRQGVADRTRFEVENLYVTDIGRATVLTLFLFPRVNLDLRPRLLRELKPGTRIVSHEFDFGNWRPDAQARVAVPDKPYGPPYSTVYLWIVPADASGRWSWRDERAATYGITVRQTFQQVEVTPAQAGQRVEHARLSGDTLEFVVASGARRVHYRGRIAGDALRGTAQEGDAATPWAATRLERGSMDIEAQGAGGAPPPDRTAKESR